MKQINILMIKNLGKKDDTLRLNTIVYTTLEIIRKISFMLVSNYPRINIKNFENIFYKRKEINFHHLKT